MTTKNTKSPTQKKKSKKSKKPFIKVSGKVKVKTHFSTSDISFKNWQGFLKTALHHLVMELGAEGARQHVNFFLNENYEPDAKPYVERFDENGEPIKDGNDKSK